MSLIEKDDIREYDPYLWIKTKQNNKIVKEKAIKRDKIIKEKIERKIKEPKEPKEKVLRNQYKKEYYEKNKDRIKKNQQNYYNGNGKTWYENNKNRLKELRKQRQETQETKTTKYLYNWHYYQNNKNELNRKRREKNKLLRDQKKSLIGNDKEKSYSKKYYDLNKVKILKRKKEYYEDKKSNIIL